MSASSNPGQQDSSPGLTSSAYYEVLAQRVLARDAMMWQTPALSLTAQAFLFTIALSGGSSQAARLLSSALAAVVSFLSMQLMARHRYYIRLDEALLGKLEADSEVALAVEVAPHTEPMKRRDAAGVTLPPWPVSVSSFTVWLVGLGLFGIAALVAFFIAAFWPTTL